MSSERSSSSTTWVVGKTLCIVSAVTYGLLTGLIDVLDPHHLRNPDWPGHARFHLLWLISAGAIGALASIHLFWTATPRTLERVRTGALLGALHIGGFVMAVVFKGAAGAEFDANGRVLLGFLPPNLLHLGTSAALLFAGVSLCHKKGAVP
ncbi:hypothetical protein [Sorangium sp. So ce1000]|uniref:hypothetical protein n=1 Tax=Sorangium sp. So ce1000 TaxID=3133325 RepID=UPI003F62393C